MQIGTNVSITNVGITNVACTNVPNNLDHLIFVNPDFTSLDWDANNSGLNFFGSNNESKLFCLKIVFAYKIKDLKHFMSKKC